MKNFREMNIWIQIAIGLLIFGTLFPLMSGDGGAAAEGMISGLGVLIIVLIIVGILRLMKSLVGNKN